MQRREERKMGRALLRCLDWQPQKCNIKIKIDTPCHVGLTVGTISVANDTSEQWGQMLELKVAQIFPN